MTSRPQRIHRFAAGLCFDTVARYCNANGRWRVLPAGSLQRVKVSSLAAQQAVALLTGRWPQAMPVNADGAPEARALLRGLSSHLSPKAITSVDITDVSTLGSAATQVIEQGGLMLLQMAVLDPTPKKVSTCRWVLVVGVEQELQPGRHVPDVPRVCTRALLIRDSALDDQWACGHNAKLEIGSPARSEDLKRKRPATLVYRSMDGGLHKVQLLMALSLRPCGT